MQQGLAPREPNTDSAVGTRTQIVALRVCPGVAHEDALEVDATIHVTANLGALHHPPHACAGIGVVNFAVTRRQQLQLRRRPLSTTWIRTCAAGDGEEGEGVAGRDSLRPGSTFLRMHTPGWWIARRSACCPAQWPTPGWARSDLHGRPEQGPGPKMRFCVSGGGFASLLRLAPPVAARRIPFLRPAAPAPRFTCVALSGDVKVGACVLGEALQPADQEHARVNGSALVACGGGQGPNRTEDGPLTRQNPIAGCKGPIGKPLDHAGCCDPPHAIPVLHTRRAPQLLRPTSARTHYHVGAGVAVAPAHEGG